MLDVGVGQQQVIGLQRSRRLDAAPHGPQLAGPAGRHRACRNDGQPVAGTAGGRSRARRLGGAVGAVVVDEHDIEATTMILPQQRGDRAANEGIFVAGRNDRDDPARRRRTGHRQHRPQPPEAAAEADQIDPDQNARRAQQSCCHRPPPQKCVALLNTRLPGRVADEMSRSSAAYRVLPAKAAASLSKIRIARQFTI